MWSRRAAVRAFVLGGGTQGAWSRLRLKIRSRNGEGPRKGARHLQVARDLCGRRGRIRRGSVAWQGGTSLSEATAGTLRVTEPPRVARRERALVRAAQAGD